MAHGARFRRGADNDTSDSRLTGWHRQPPIYQESLHPLWQHADHGQHRQLTPPHRSRAGQMRSRNVGQSQLRSQLRLSQPRCRTTRRTTSRPATSGPTWCPPAPPTTRRAAAMPTYSTCARRPPRRRQWRAVTPARRSLNCAIQCAWTGTPWMSSWRRTSPSAPTPRPLHQGRRSHQLPACPSRRQRRHRCRLRPAPDPVRNRPSAALLPPARRRPAGPAPALGHAVALPLQGHGQLLVSGCGQRSPRGLRLDLLVPAGGEPVDRRARLLLQRDRRPLPQRRPPAAAAHETQLIAARRCLHGTRRPTWVRERACRHRSDPVPQLGRGRIRAGATVPWLRWAAGGSDHQSAR